jgi:hypothetical protein
MIGSMKQKCSQGIELTVRCAITLLAFNGPFKSLDTPLKSPPGMLFQPS